jgi:2-methylisocitrate lyase-like PEP mutase family enzyme
MDVQAQIGKARSFKKMHDRSTMLVLPNAWDAMTARLFARLGVSAVATTSGGVAWSLGYPDGERAPLQEVLAATGRIARSVELPVTATGNRLRATPDALPIGARRHRSRRVGVNLEDGLHRRFAPEAGDRIMPRARPPGARRAAAINARTDTYPLEYGASDAERFEEMLAREGLSRRGSRLHYPIGLGVGDRRR